MRLFRPLASSSLAALAVAVGCGSPASKIATPPTFNPKDQTKCQVKASQSRPLIVEWPSADRAALEAQAKRGLVVVKYSGCEMEVLRRCRAPGAYSYTGTTRKHDRVTMRSEDDLYAHLPLGAAALEGKLKSAGALNVDMVIVGTWDADRPEVRQDELEGSCSGATHVVSSLTAGAFDFYAGASADVGGGVSTPIGGGGASSSSKREVLNEDGNETACTKATSADKEPPDDCGAILRLEVVPIGGVPAMSAPAAAAAPVPAPAPVTAPAPAHAESSNVPIPVGVETASMDTSTLACADFFTYACGGWIKAHPLGGDRARVTRFDEVLEKNQQKLRDLLEHEASAPDADVPFAKELGAFYASCMDEAAIERAGASAIATELAAIDKVSDAASFARALARLHTLDADAFFAIGAEPDLKNPTQMIAAIEQARLGMRDRDWYSRTDDRATTLRATYAAHVEKVFALLGDKPADAKTNAAAVVALETALAAAELSRVERRDPNKVYHPSNRAELGRVAPHLAWDAYFAELGLPASAIVNVESPSYLAQVDKQVAAGQWATAIRPYLRFQLGSRLAPYLTSAFVDEDFAFNKKELQGAASLDPRWKRCVAEADRRMGDALGAAFVKSAFGGDSKSTATAIVRGVESAMQGELGRVAWMDAATRARALEKLKKVTNKIGAPDTARSYDGLAIDRSAYAANVVRALRFGARQEIAHVGKPVDRGEWEVTAPTLNAYYNPQKNGLVFPAGILQAPFFAARAPQAVSFGAFGAILGHELTHGFDDTGRQFDANGALQDWWTPTVAQAYAGRSQCLIDQFDAYVAVDDVHVNGKLTLGENIADLGGLRVAYRALHEASPTASIDADRQFFLGYAQTWCSVSSADATRTRARVDPHAPPQWRVNGAVSNMPEFARAFGCSASSAMVRPQDKRCEVW